MTAVFTDFPELNLKKMLTLNILQNSGANYSGLNSKETLYSFDGPRVDSNYLENHSNEIFGTSPIRLSKTGISR
jgi:hypothetical protein